MAHQRLINWNDDYCPNGHRWVFCHSSLLYPDFYYCPKEDKMWEPIVAEIDENKVKENYNAERPEAMRRYAKKNIIVEQVQNMDYETAVRVVKLAAKSTNKE